MWTLCTHQA